MAGLFLAVKNSNCFLSSHRTEIKGSFYHWDLILPDNRETGLTDPQRWVSLNPEIKLTFYFELMHTVPLALSLLYPYWILHTGFPCTLSAKTILHLFFGYLSTLVIIWLPAVHTVDGTYRCSKMLDKWIYERANGFFFWGGGGKCHVACGVLVPQPGIEPGPPTVEVPSPNLWTTRECLHLGSLPPLF